MSGRLAIVYQDSREPIDAIRAYSRCLVAALGRRGIQAVLLLRTRAGLWAVIDADGPPRRIRYISRLQDELTSSDTAIVQYNPFSFGRWGFAPWLPIALWRLRRAASSPVIALMVHEPYVPMVNWRFALMGASQRVQLMALQACADILFASIERWARDLGRLFRRKNCGHLAIGSILPDVRASRLSERQRIGIAPDAVAVATLGAGHPSRLDDYVVASVNALARAGQETWLLNLGAGPLRQTDLDERVKVHKPGALSSQMLARQLAAADIFLAPYVDGVSTRRTTLMAALQHGLAVVGTDGPLTDTVLRHAQHSLRLVPVGEAGLFSSAVEQLAESRDDRVALGLAGRALYEKCFDWPVLTDRLLAGLEAARSKPVSVGALDF